MSSATIGIDLGTTHSLVAVVLQGKARVLLDDDERALLPSAVRLDDSGQPRALGWAALAEAGEPDGTTFVSFKRFMGRSAAECAEEAARLRYRLAPDASGTVRLQAGPRAVTPVELSALVLRMLHARAEDCLMTRPTGAVITVPAYFDDAQRQATRDAARVAGVELLRLLNEPTAAAIAYGLDHAQDGRKVAVYDLGGGTFDLSLLELDDGVFQVLATAGDTRLGGDDFDHALAEWLAVAAGGDFSALADREARALLRAAEAAKRGLSEADSVSVSVPTPAGGLVEVDVTRAIFDGLIEPHLDRTAALVQRALGDAGLQLGDIDEVVLVGGSTRVPRVRSFVEALFGRPPHCSLDPDCVVALGAAVQADALSARGPAADAMLLLDVLPLSLGVEMMGGVTERIIPRTTTIPATAHQTFTTHVDDQTAVELHVVQGERELAKDNRSLARFFLRLPPMPAGMPRVKVEFAVDADGILAVSAVEEHTGEATQITVQATYGLPEEEIEQMLEDAIDHAEDDIDERLLIEARVEGEQILTALRKALADDRAMLQADEGDQFVAAAAALEAALAGTDRRAIQQAGERVDRLTAPFAQRRIERDLAQVIQGQLADAVADTLGLESR